MKTIKEIINFISPDLIPKLKSFDFWLNIFVVAFGGISVATAIYFAIKLVIYLN